MVAGFLLVDKDKRTWDGQERVETVVGIYSEIQSLILASKAIIETKKDENSQYGAYHPGDLIVYEISEMNSIVPMDIKCIGYAETIVKLFDRNEKQTDIKTLFGIFSNKLYENLVLAMLRDIISPESSLSKQEKENHYRFLIDCTDVLMGIDEENSLLMDICKAGIHMYEEELYN